MARDFNVVSNVAIVLAAIAVGGTSLYNAFLRPTPRSGGLDPNAPPEFVENWDQLQRIGIRTGDSAAPVQIVEFADLECPFCAKYEATLAALMERYPGKVSRVFIHFPLEMHPYARRAAQAVECAAERGVFESALGRVYSHQLDFSTNPWSKIALEVGVKDTIEFSKCVFHDSERPRIKAGERVAKQIALAGTPTVLINGYLYVGAPPDSILDRAVVAIMGGKKVPNASSNRSTRRVDISVTN